MFLYQLCTGVQVFLTTSSRKLPWHLSKDVPLSISRRVRWASEVIDRYHSSGAERDVDIIWYYNLPSQLPTMEELSACLQGLLRHVSISQVVLKMDWGCEPMTNSNHNGFCLMSMTLYTTCCMACIYCIICIRPLMGMGTSMSPFGGWEDEFPFP